LRCWSLRPATSASLSGLQSPPTRWQASLAGAVASAASELQQAVQQADCRHENSPLSPAPIAESAFVGFCFPPDVIVLAVRWYLRFALSYRDVEELLAERGIQVDHVTVYRWVVRFTPLLAEAARPCRHVVGDRWCVDETYVKVAGRWRYVDRAVDQAGQVIDVFVSPRRDARAARRFFERALGAATRTPVEGRHRPGSHLPGRAGRAAADGLASHRSVCQ
jgi:transposase, IS6 family